MHEAMDCIQRLEAIHVNGDDCNVSLLSFKPYTLCGYTVVDDILLDMDMVQRKRFLNGWRLYCLAHKKEQLLIEQQLLDLNEINKVSQDVQQKSILKKKTFFQGSSGERWHANVICFD